MWLTTELENEGRQSESPGGTKYTSVFNELFKKQSITKFITMKNSQVESVINRETGETKLVFSNIEEVQINAIPTVFNITMGFRHIFIDVKKNDLVEMMWKFKLSRKEIKTQLVEFFKNDSVFLNIKDSL